MRILIADDDPLSRETLAATLAFWGYEAVAALDGEQAWQALRHPDAPQLVLLDWMMPEADGVEVCRRVRAIQKNKPLYIIMITARVAKEDIVTALESGADDYLTKPFDPVELHARLKVGRRILDLQGKLAARVVELEHALAHIKQLQGLIPICSYCKRVRDDTNSWLQIEAYISDHSDAKFSHGICPKCFVDVVQPELEKYQAE